MEVYVVGGAVRDALLGLPVRDQDYVVVGARVEDLLAAGYRPVGKDFPVFLHPQTQAEYALARTERKTGSGHTGFTVHAAPEVSLEQDLARRDLTINAMARAADGALIDPYGGQHDLQARVFRHVSPAFREDPLRVLRIARFAARFADFSLAPETLALCQEMVAEGELATLAPERVWQELSRGLMEAAPQRMLETLRSCDALAALLPEVDRLFGVPQPAAHHPEVDTGAHLLLVLAAAAHADAPLAVRWACLLHDLGKACTPPQFWPRHHGHEKHSAALATSVSERLRAPAECRDLARIVAAEHGLIHRAAELRPRTVLELLERCDALRRPERFAQVLLACACDARGRKGMAHRPYPQAERLMAALAAARNVDAGAIARACSERGAIPERVRLARVAAIRAQTAAPASASGVTADSNPLQDRPGEQPEQD